MNKLLWFRLFAALAIAVFESHPAGAQDGVQSSQIFVGDGICEPSAGIIAKTSDGRQFLVVANDGDNVLRAYELMPYGVRSPTIVQIRRGEQSAGSALSVKPEQSLDDFFRIPESDRGRGRGRADLEGAARLGNLVFWIGSHSRSSDGEQRGNRYQFFATSAELHQASDSTDISLNTFGFPRSLIASLVAERLGLRSAIGLDKDGKPLLKDAAAEKGGLNIEGLVRDVEDQGLLIGLRSPLHAGSAIILPFSNPRETIADLHVNPIIGEPIELDLGGRGIRSIEYIHDAVADRRYLIVAGPADAGDDFTLYRWSGLRGQKPVEIPNVGETLIRLAQAQDGRGLPFRFGPEAGVVDISDPEKKTIYLLSDDGDRHMFGAKTGASCQEDDTPLASRSFRGLILRLN